MGQINERDEAAVFRKVAWKLIPLLFICYIAAFLDRVNVGFAKLQMAPDLGFSDLVYGFGAGLFFIGYFLFEVPSNLILQKVGARRWIARIMITWGIISSMFAFTDVPRWGALSAGLGLSDAEFTFYLLRFLLGVAEAGFFPGIILYLTYWFPGARRAQIVAWFMTAIAVSNLVGSPASGLIMQGMDDLGGWRGWQWLFIVMGVPSVFLGVLVLNKLPDGPRHARWLSPGEQALVAARVAEDEAGKASAGAGHSLGDAFKNPQVWALSLVYFFGAGCLYAVNFWMPTIIQELGIPKTDYLRIGLIAAIPWGAAAVAMVLWARRSDRTGERRWHAAIAMGTAGVGLACLAFVGQAPVPAILALTLVTCGTLSWIATFWSIPTAFLSGTAAAAGIAWINSVGNLGGHFGPDLIGRIRTASGGDATTAFLTLAAGAAAGALILILLPKPAPTDPA